MSGNYLLLHIKTPKRESKTSYLGITVGRWFTLILQSYIKLGTYPGPALRKNMQNTLAAPITALSVYSVLARQQIKRSIPSRL
jgi:hypothetical protein